MSVLAALFGLLTLLFVSSRPVCSFAQASASPAKAAAPGSPDTVPPGTKITMQNWQQYQQFMPEGMVAFFQGKYFWKMPQDVSMEVGPTIIHPLPKTYLEATEKYSSQVKVIELPDGGLTLENYQGGIPFPNPSEPHKGWKILTNLWYRYVPHLTVIQNGGGCLIDHYGSVNCQAAEIVERQLSFNTDAGIPANTPNSDGKYFSEWLMVLEPEQKRYTALLDVSYTDPARSEDQYAFLPALRRYQPISSAARCSPSEGTDATPEELRSGFDSNLTWLKVDLVGEKKILALIDITPPTAKFPDSFDMPLGWPTPAWGKWQLRDVYVLNVSRLPSHQSGYCYGKRVMYVDKQFSAVLWEDMYDMKMQPWKSVAMFLQTCNVPGIGPVNSCGSDLQSYWDIQNDHATFFLDYASPGHPVYTNGDAPNEFTDLVRYTTAPGLNLIMR
ncbi:MAG TPA: DUF1329 domain-containing protein [Candidatus Binataceae bacterium]|nr:DUF1329 domain-containing protein [Candidatus Binataceae bacterium]